MRELNLSAADIAQFHADGFIVVDQVINRARIERVRERIDCLFNGKYGSGLMPGEVNWLAGRDD